MGETPCWEGARPTNNPVSIGGVFALTFRSRAPSQQGSYGAGREIRPTNRLHQERVCFDVQEQSSFTARELWGWEGALLPTNTAA